MITAGARHTGESTSQPAGEHVHTLITGGAGFIGSHLAEHLLQLGHHVVVVDDLSTGSAQNLSRVAPGARLTIAVGSVLDEVLVNRLIVRCDQVFHLAAAHDVRAIADHPLQSLRTNLYGTDIVLAAANEHHKPVLLASSGEVYGKNRAPSLDEDADRILGASLNSRWSHAAVMGIDEALAYGYYREYRLPVTIARLFNTVGPRQYPWYGAVIPTIIGQALRDEPITVFGDGEQTRCFSYVDDVVPALARLADTPAATGRAVNLGSPEEISINSLAERIVTVLSSASPIVHLPYSETYGPGYEDMQQRAPDISLARKLVGFDPRTTVDEMILHVADSLMTRGALVTAGGIDLWAS
jgi:UDP-glucose 4-epimerase